MSCDVGKAREGLENELWRRWSDRKVGEWTELIVIAELILQAFSHFTYVTVHSDFPSFPSLHLRHSSFPYPSLILPTSQLILQPFRCCTYVTAHSPTLLSPLLRHRIFSYVTWRAAHATDVTAPVLYNLIIFYVTNLLSLIPPLWARRQHARLSRCGPGFDPRSGQVSWVRFFSGFSSPVRQMSGSFRPPRSPNIIWPSLSSFITGANDLRCWRALKP